MVSGGRAPAWPDGYAAEPRPIPARPSVSVCATWAMPIAEAREWFGKAAAGAVLVYATGPTLLRGETSRWVVGLATAGLAEPTQKRAEGCFGYEYRLRKVGDPAAPARPADDPATARILAELKRAARRGERCPSDRALAVCAGLATTRAAGWRVTALRDAGEFSITTVTGPDGPWRTITFPGGGSTEPPPAAGERR